MIRNVSQWPDNDRCASNRIRLRSPAWSGAGKRFNKENNLQPTRVYWRPAAVPLTVRTKLPTCLHVVPSTPSAVTFCPKYALFVTKIRGKKLFSLRYRSNLTFKTRSTSFVAAISISTAVYADGVECRSMRRLCRMNPFSQCLFAALERLSVNERFFGWQKNPTAK